MEDKENKECTVAEREGMD